MIASLPMYDRPETAGANDTIWTAISHACGGDAPPALSRPSDPWEHWLSPDLFLSQTCGLPFRARLHDRLALIATPDYGVEGCEPGFYQSVVVARAADAHIRPADYPELTIAYNEPLSQSGWAAAAAHAAGHGSRFTRGLRTGSHLASARAVATGAADIAFLDAVTWRQISRWETVSGDLAVIDWTEPTPGLPLVTAFGDRVPEIRTAVSAGLEEAPSAALELTGIRGIAIIDAARYLALGLPPQPPR